MSNQKFVVFTDGSCINNGKKNSIGAIGIFFKENDNDNLGQIIENDNNKITNQTMELLAVIKAMQIIDNKIQNKIINEQIIYIYTDSIYVINTQTKWYQIWEKNNWLNTKQKPVENKELIQLLYTLKNKYIVIFKHVRSHQKEPNDKKSELYNIWYGNYMADSLATNACKNYMKNIQTNNNTINDDGLVIAPKKINKKKVNNIMNV